ncbi:hypothetical protein OIU84_028365 [Salix udensis]|uniref:Eukaryotic translation initiation factor isoform 4E n=1 Tax=Salix udensis TaxID=889485 RepID=A0AAD6KCG7_9ROSI|nr:hypothetical protein OIU84_028365 [Salix udensis]
MAAIANEAAATMEGSDTETIEKPLPHKLERKWAFWFTLLIPSKNSGACMSRYSSQASCLEMLISIYLELGLNPKWEDPVCATGGKWSFTSIRNANLDTMWLETLMALIGEQFDEADEICGVVASVRRQRQDKLALWTKTAANEAVQWQWLIL